MEWRWVRALGVRVRALVAGKRAEDDLHDELSFHLAMQVRAHMESGLSEAEAVRRARLALGGIEPAKERARDVRPLRGVDAFLHDLRDGWRTILRTPMVSAAIVATFALGIGANAAIFSLLDSVLLTPLPYHEPERIVVVEPLYTNTGRINPTSSAPDFHDWRGQNQALEFLAYHTGGEFTALVNGMPAFAAIQVATTDFFKVFGARAAAGRLWTGQDSRSAAAIVSREWAAAHFGEAGAAVGRSIVAAGRPAEIVGVVGDGFRFPGSTDIWLPSSALPETPSRGAHNYFVVGRVKAGVGLDEARADMRGIAARLERAYPENRFKSIALTPLQDKLTSGARVTLWLLFGIVAGVMLIACVNVAHLQLVRAAARTREIAVRCAIGAGPGRIIRQVLAESALLGLAGCILGLAAGWLTLEGFLAVAPADIPRLDEVRIDGRVFAFALVVTTVCSVLFGIGPARYAARADTVANLQSQAGRGTLGRRFPRTRSALVVAEVAVSVVLLVAAGLLLRSFVELTRVDLGFSTNRLLVTSAAFPITGPAEFERATAFYEELVEDVRGLPGVDHTAGVRTMPFVELRASSRYSIDGGRSYGPGEGPQAQIQVITPGYFETVGTPLLQGRDFADGDRQGRPLVAIVNQRLVRETFGAGNPIGRIIRTGMTRESMQGMQIVGVVGDTRQLSPEDPPQAEIFLPYLQHPGPASRLTLVTLTPLPPEALTAAIREAARRLNPEVPVRFSTMEDAFGNALAYPRFRTMLVASFALLAVGLALVGIYGVLSYLVIERTPEIGVRLALGALRREIFRHVIGGSLKPVFLGMAIGLPAALLAVEALQAVLFEVEPRDPLTIAAVLGAVTAASLAASSIPALRAASLDPLVALRDE